MHLPDVRQSTAVHIELFGRTAVRSEAGVGVLPEGSRAALALARLALAQGQAVTRDELADVIWGERPPATWQGALRNVAAEVRCALARAGVADAVVAAGGGWRLELPPDSSVDLLAFEADADAARQMALAGDEEAALRLARSTLEIASSPVLPGAQAEWADELRDHVDAIRATLAVTGAQAALALGDQTEAERLARIAIDIAPAREDGHRLLMHALAVSGNRGAALAAYERCRDVLERDFATRPSAETEELRRTIVEDPPATHSPLGASEPIAGWRRTADYGLRVARTALDAGEFDDAVAAAQRALAVLTSAGDPDPGRRIDLTIALGAAQRALGWAEGFATLYDAAAAARAIGDGERLADAALAFTHTGAAGEEAFVDDMVLELYEEAVALLGDRDPARRARLLGHLSVAHAWTRGGPGVRSAARQALEIAAASGDDVLRADAITTVRRALASSADVDRQETLEDDLFALADRLDDPGAHARALVWRFQTRIEQGRGDELEGLIDAADRVATGLRAAHYHHTIAYSRAALVMLRGDLDRGEALLEEAAAMGRRRGLAGLVVDAVRMAQIVCLRGEQGRMAEIVAPALELFRGAGMDGWLGMVALLEAERGNTGAARAALDEFVAAYAKRGPTMLCGPGLAAYAAHAVARLDDSESAAVLYPLLVSFAGRGAYLAYFTGPFDYALGQLARTLGRSADSKRHFADSAAFCDVLVAPLWAQRSREQA